jgi:7-carboxy-7-deazaguanine synthase (Cx14CxxC type)
VPYAVKEIFYTLQGEGAHSGRPAVFLRFAGCNLWSGRADDRTRSSAACAAWCDTDFIGVDGTDGGKYATADDLAGAVLQSWSPPSTRRFVVCTGGEPLLQLDTALVAALRARGFTVAVETNGTVESPAAVDWLAVSPKLGAPLRVRSGNELKIAFPQPGLDPRDYEHLAFEHFFVQPVDDGRARENTAAAIQFCLENPRWRLSTQLHKTVGVR